jgi:hypothetical protein
MLTRLPRHYLTGFDRPHRLSPREGERRPKRQCDLPAYLSRTSLQERTRAGLAGR